MRVQPRTWFGIACTSVWLTFLWSYWLEDPARFAGLPPNEFGDFLAGAFAPLAFLWLVIGYAQQGEELQQNTAALLQQEKALRLQASELKQSVQAQQQTALEQKRLAELSAMQVKAMILTYQPDFEALAEHHISRIIVYLRSKRGEVQDVAVTYHRREQLVISRTVGTITTHLIDLIFDLEDGESRCTRPFYVRYRDGIGQLQQYDYQLQVAPEIPPEVKLIKKTCDDAYTPSN